MSANKQEIVLADGKYIYRREEGRQEVLRYGEPWRDLTGDKFVYCMADRIAELEKRGGWTAVADDLPPDETPVFIMCKGRPRVGEIRWERPGYEDTFTAYQYWDDPEDDGQEWEWDDVTHWMLIPEVTE